MDNRGRSQHPHAVRYPCRTATPGRDGRRLVGHPTQRAWLCVGDRLPSWVDLGLEPQLRAMSSMFLIDPTRGRVYRTLSHQSRRLFNRCLCTPLWLAQQGLRIGETRMLQATFPPLPDALSFIDVDLINRTLCACAGDTDRPSPYSATCHRPGAAARGLATGPGGASFPLPSAAGSRPEHHHRPSGGSARSNLEWTISRSPISPPSYSNPRSRRSAASCPMTWTCWTATVVSGPMIKPLASRAPSLCG